ncbi:ABC transporter ATP-binding protein [Poseidonocella sedimentorum]|uniref:NitT/TauT family transport system ATP-binding protein n=1 Tax=Poseidonocella sedimentorum TaxID=871652 RepID=A0A1I6D3E6_9RHOB|nr:ABC transporter ATP-binding protein [Poseidonocella sedimentorum]SFR00024.1 NitT/TauT family transport system ATP-binding protein [Poseidonocella sedimentorum]
MITVDIRAKSFGKTQVLGPISFSVETGETLAILGPSGIGKSTLLRIVAGIDTRFDGTVQRPGSCAIVFQEPTLLPWRSALQNLCLVHPGLDEAAAREALGRVGLGDKADLFPGQLSLGQQRRLALARAFAGEPDLLIMDEPFVSLDAETAETMLALTEALLADVAPAAIFVTHARAEAERLATRIIELQGAPATVRLDPQPGQEEGDPPHDRA